jgi:hypothetical protein
VSGALEDPEEHVDFMAKYRDWVSIKRLGIHPTTKPEEVVHHLAAIRSTIERKSYIFLGIKTEMLDEHAKSLCSGMRKNYSSLASAINKMSDPETKRVLESASGKELMPIAEAYLLGRVVNTIGFDTEINQAMMSRIFPDLKPPRVPGRLGKSKRE